MLDSTSGWPSCRATRNIQPTVGLALLFGLLILPILLDWPGVGSLVITIWVGLKLTVRNPSPLLYLIFSLNSELQAWLYGCLLVLLISSCMTIWLSTCLINLFMYDYMVVWLVSSLGIRCLALSVVLIYALGSTCNMEGFALHPYYSWYLEAWFDNMLVWLFALCSLSFRGEWSLHSHSFLPTFYMSTLSSTTDVTLLACVGGSYLGCRR